MPGYTASALTHDLNNIFAVIRINAQLLRTPACDRDRHAELLRRIEELADDGCTLMSRLLAASRHSDGSFTPLDMNELVVRVGDALDALAGSSVDVIVDARAGRTPVCVERVPGEQLVMNLGRNAIDALVDGGTVELITTVVEVPRSNHWELTPGQYFELTVVDTGPGISSEIAKTLFDPFVTTKAGRGGAGLGLAIAHETVTSAGGAIRAENGVRRGAIVSVLLPLAPSDGHSESQPVRAPDH